MHMASIVVGYRGNEEGIFTTDSYVLRLLVECGIPRLVSFFGLVLVAIVLGARQYLGNKDATVALPFMASFTAFLVYRLVLSQDENHTFLFILLGLWGVLYTLLVQNQKKEMGSMTALREETPSRARPFIKRFP